MTTITTTIARFVALPIVAAGIAGGAALGLASAAGATTTTTTTGPTSSVSTINGNFNAPTTYASPAYNPQPGVQAWRYYHRG